MRKVKKHFNIRKLTIGDKSQKTRDRFFAIFYLIMGIITTILYLNVMFEIPLCFFGLAAGELLRIYFKSKKNSVFSDKYYDKVFNDLVDDDFDWDYYESGRADMDKSCLDTSNK